MKRAVASAGPASTNWLLAMVQPSKPPAGPPEYTIWQCSITQFLYSVLSR